LLPTTAVVELSAQRRKESSARRFGRLTDNCKGIVRIVDRSLLPRHNNRMPTKLERTLIKRVREEIRKNADLDSEKSRVSDTFDEKQYYTGRLAGAGDTGPRGHDCARTTLTANNVLVTCELRQGHAGPHVAYWTDRDGRRQILLSWAWERDGYAVWPKTPGAEKA